MKLLEQVSEASRTWRLALGSLAVAFLAGASMEGEDLIKHWATTYETNLGGGYDSNIYGWRFEEISDGFLSASQLVQFSRRHSLTTFDIKGNLVKTYYFDERDADYLDGGIEINAAYPNDDKDVTFWKGNAFWSKVSQVNLSAGRRIQPEVYGARLGGEWLFSPKTGIVGSLNGTVTDRSSDGYSTSKSMTFRTGMSTAWRTEKRLNLEYALAMGESDSGSGSESVEHSLGLRARGSLTPKIKGDVYLGYRSSDFSGVSEFSDDGPAVSIDLTWFANPVLTAVVGFENKYDFTANGDVELSAIGFFQVKRDLGKGYNATLRIERGDNTYENDLADGRRFDDYWRFKAELEYSFTRRFYARLTANVIDSSSSEEGFEIDRKVFELSSGLRY